MPPRRRWPKARTVLIATPVVFILACVTLFGLAGANSEMTQKACKADAQTVMLAIDAYHSVNGTWPPAGPVDKTSVLVLPGHPGLPYLATAPSSDKYAINTDGAGGVLVAVPPASSGGINYEDATTGKVPGVSNPCNKLSDD